MRARVRWVLLAAATSLGGCAAGIRNHRVLDAPEGAWNWVARDERPAVLAEAQEPPPKQDSKSQEAKPAAKEEEPEGRSLVHILLLYIPNRILDVFDIARFGVDVGPGFGIDLTATEFLRLGFLSRFSVGAGLQTLRHMPVKGGAESYNEIGPLSANTGFPISWYRNTWDLRVEAHVLLVGAHVAVNPAEILDAILGFTTFDLMNDDF